MIGAAIFESFLQMTERITVLGHFGALLAAYCFFLYRLRDIHLRRHRHQSVSARHLWFPVVLGGVLGGSYAVVFCATLWLSAPAYFRWSYSVEAMMRWVSILFFVVGGAALSPRLALPFFPLTRRCLRCEWRKLRPSWRSVLIFVLMWAVCFMSTAWLVSAFDVRTGRALEDPVLQQLQRHTSLMLAFAVNAAVWEECTYRQFLFPFFAWVGSFVLKKHVALVVSAALVTVLFAIAHSGTMEPIGAKLFQVALLSLCTLVCQKKFGIEVTILFHAWFNVSMVWLT